MRKRGKLLLMMALLAALCMAAVSAMAELTITGGAYTNENGVYTLTDLETYTISGDTTQGVCMTTPGATLILDGVTIKTKEKPALEIATGILKGTVMIILADGKDNTLDSSEAIDKADEKYNNFAGLQNMEDMVDIRCEGTAQGHKCDTTCGSLTVKGGTYGAGIGGAHGSPGGNIIIRGGNITVTGGGAGIGGGTGGRQEGHDIQILGGTIVATGNNGAGIGGGNMGRGYNIWIENADVTAKGDVGIGGGGGVEDVMIMGSMVMATGHDAGIGGGVDTSAKNITITDSTVTATGEKGIGIGCSKNSSAENITITGSTLTAIAGDGAGIGCGEGGSVENITITDSVVTANGKYCSAGIGCGERGSVKNITIADSTVTATGTGGGAGIGGGSDGNVENVTITDSVVTANGSDSSAGIGGGSNGDAQNVKITGGTVTAIGGEKADGVGKGQGGKAKNIFVSPDAGELLDVRIGMSAETAVLELIEIQTDITEMCDELPYFHSEAHSHDGGMANCQNAAVCTGCERPYGDTDGGNHIGGTEIRGDVEAQEFADGYTGDTYCLGCNTKIADGEVLFATHVHDYQQANDESGHWMECACGNTISHEAHIPGPAATQIIPQSCIECGWEIASAVKMDSLPQTGDDSRIVLWTGMLCLTGVAMRLLRKRRTN